MDQNDFICNVKIRTIHKKIYLFIVFQWVFPSSSECLCKGHVHIIKHILIVKSRSDADSRDETKLDRD